MKNIAEKLNEAQVQKKIDDDDGEDNEPKILDEAQVQADAFVDAVTGESDEYYKKWSAIVILGPFIPAVLSLIIIFSGQLVLNTWTGYCGYALPSFISAAITVCYLFLLIYSWVFIGTHIVIRFPLIGPRTIAVPFTSLKWVIFLYAVIGFGSFITWIVGTVLYNLAYFCQTTSPGLYNYTLFLIAIYWLFFSIIGLYMVKIFFGTKIGTVLRESTRDATVHEAELSVFEAKFAMFDPEKERMMKSEDFPAFLKELGIFVPEEEMETLISTFDPEETEKLKYDLMIDWFKKYLAEREDDILNDAPEDIPTDKEELAIYNAEKKKRLQEKINDRKKR